MKMMGEEEKIALMKKKLSWEKREKEQESNRQKKRIMYEEVESSNDLDRSDAQIRGKLGERGLSN